MSFKTAVLNDHDNELHKELDDISNITEKLKKSMSSFRLVILWIQPKIYSYNKPNKLIFTFEKPKILTVFSLISSRMKSCID